MRKQIEATWYELKQFVNPIRPTINVVKKLNRKHLIGVEIGTYLGQNAQNILQNLSINKLYLVDSYTPYTEDIGWEGNEDIYIHAKNRLKSHSNKIIFIRKFSDDALDDIEEKVDFVYIDGNHQYEYVRRDVRNYYPLVKKGGVIGGHDFFTDNGVANAITEFARKNRLKLYLRRPDWWIEC